MIGEAHRQARSPPPVAFEPRRSARHDHRQHADDPGCPAPLHGSTLTRTRARTSKDASAASADGRAKMCGVEIVRRFVVLVGVVAAGVAAMLWMRPSTTAAVDPQRLTYVATAEQLGVVGYRDPVGAVSLDGRASHCRRPAPLRAARRRRDPRADRDRAGTNPVRRRRRHRIVDLRRPGGWQSMVAGVGPHADASALHRSPGDRGDTDRRVDAGAPARQRSPSARRHRPMAGSSPVSRTVPRAASSGASRSTARTPRCSASPIGSHGPRGRRPERSAARCSAGSRLAAIAAMRPAAADPDAGSRGHRAASVFTRDDRRVLRVADRRWLRRVVGSRSLEPRAVRRAGFDRDTYAPSITSSGRRPVQDADLPHVGRRDRSHVTHVSATVDIAGRDAVVPPGWPPHRRHLRHVATGDGRCEVSRHRARNWHHSVDADRCPGARSRPRSSPRRTPRIRR